MLKIVAAGSIVLLMATMACADGGSTEATPSAPMPPLERIKAVPKGELKNPYKDDNAAIVAEGQKLYMKSGCNGCHGGSGGGGMCPPLSNDTWVYGGDDDTLFRLISLGTDGLTKEGYARKGRENVVGPMMAHGAILKTDDDLWKVITFIRSNYRGGPTKKFGDQPAAPK